MNEQYREIVDRVWSLIRARNIEPQTVYLGRREYNVVKDALREGKPTDEQSHIFGLRVVVVEMENHIGVGT